VQRRIDDLGLTNQKGKEKWNKKKNKKTTQPLSCQSPARERRLTSGAGSQSMSLQILTRSLARSQTGRISGGLVGMVIAVPWLVEKTKSNAHFYRFDWVGKIGRVLA
jgi:hypothetical protein